MGKNEQVLVGDHKNKENVQRKLMLYIALYTVKKGYRFSLSKPGLVGDNPPGWGRENR
jgi:hypothetical protein